MIKHRDVVEAAAEYTGYLNCLSLPEVPGSLMGYLFIVNQVDEPIEFAYAMAEKPGNTAFWSADSVYRHATRRMIALLIEKTALTPGLIITIDAKAPGQDGRTGVPAGIFGTEVHLETPVIRLMPDEQRGSFDHSFEVPANDQANRIFDARVQRGRLFEPFDTGRNGLIEIMRQAAAKSAGGK